MVSFTTRSLNLGTNEYEASWAPEVVWTIEDSRDFLPVTLSYPTELSRCDPFQPIMNVCEEC